MSRAMPSEWYTTTLGDLAQVYSGGTPLRSVPAYWGGRIPWVTTAEIDGGLIESAREAITAAGLSASAARVASPGTLLLAMYGQGKTRGKVAMLGIAAAMNQACAAIEVGRHHDARYLFHYLTAQYDSIRSMSNAGSQENLSGEIVRQIPVVVPPIAEQRVIGQVLDDADDQIASLERLIAKKQAIRRGMMQQLLTGRTRLPGFSGAWADIKLGDHVAYVKTVALSRAQLDLTSPLRYLHYGDIHTCDDVRLDASQEPMPRATAALAGRAGRLKTGDLVFADASEDPDGVGKSLEIMSVPTEGAVPGLHTIAARFDQEILANGFKAYLQFIPAFREQLLRQASGTKVLATTRSYISSVILSLPEVSEQRAIAQVLDDCDSEIRALRARLAKARAVKTGMMQQLLTGRTRLPVKVAS